MEPYTPAQRRRAHIWHRVDQAIDLGAGWAIYVPPTKEVKL